MGKSIVSQALTLAQPIAQGLGLLLWDVEYVKEGASWFLRFYIDKPGGVTIEDCEAMSRAVDGPLDEADFIANQYYLEVSSPGIERELKKEAHFAAFLGRPVRVRLIRPLADGRREFDGTLSACETGALTVQTPEGPVTFKKSEAAFVRACDEEDVIPDDEAELGGMEKP